MHENAQEDAHEEGPASAVGLSVVLQEIQHRCIFTEKHKEITQKVMFDLDTEKRVSQMPTESISKSKVKTGVHLFISSVTIHKQ